MSNVTVHEALKAAIKSLTDSLPDWECEHGFKQNECNNLSCEVRQHYEAIEQCKSVLSEIEKCEPVAYMYHVKEEKPTSVKQHTFAALDGYALQQNETLIYKEPLFTSPQPRDWVGLTYKQKVALREENDWYNFPNDLIEATEAKCKQLNTEKG